ncbi:uncharacterized protein EV420DRAFT_1512930 [Desarmillaria tabescens]|uniref:C2H2-type domain-containing protein n=1 Tax=Armillaria tabescens TaxID=1929756 RepID=A0AA39NGC0_ARMTA|nr:uncharacterized protein EV420DRAFT_1512930 [Desarmillaria tabescens]KAK0465130.1 hypothetical protein EV420DRAFT_1512930 [Desarmillaria tabescens]
MGIRDPVGQLSRVDVFKARTAVPEVKEEEEKSLYGKVFSKEYSSSSRKQHGRLEAAWAECAENQPSDNPYKIPREINPQSVMPPRAGFIKFTQYLALCTRGLLGPYAVKKTIRTLMATVFGLWRRKALQVVPPDVRQQVYAYIDSEELQRIAPLSTKEREKFYLSAHDFDVMALGIFQDTDGFRTTRMMMQVLHALLLQSLSSERPGAIVEASSRFGSNEALCWKDYEFHILPNPDDPHSPLVVIRLKINLLKGYRKDDSMYKEFLLMPESESRVFCPVSSAVAMAIEDKIFSDVETIEEIFHPKVPPTQHHILRMRPEAADKPVLRAEVFDGLSWLLSSTRALSYGALSGHLRRISMLLGFIHYVTCYCCRRGASNRISRQMGAEDRATLMGHVEGSSKFDKHYKSRFIASDLGAVMQDRDQNVQYMEASKALSDMSSRRDENAPTKLSLEDKAKLLAEPELVEIDNERKKIANLIGSTSKQLTCADVSKESKAELDAQIASLKTEKKKLDEKYRNIVRREESSRATELRKQFFQEQSTRQLAGQTTNVTVLPITKGKENTTSSLVAERRKAPSDQAAARNNAINTFFHEVFGDDAKSSAINDGIIEFVNKYLVLTTFNRTKHIVCYPGEGLTEANKCAICDKDSSDMRQIGKHLHDCVDKQKTAEAQSNANDNYEPNPCLWQDCYSAGKIWPTRQGYIKHIGQHIKMLTQPAPTVGVKRQCLWVDEVICNKEDNNYTSADWAVHFAQEHGLNACATIAVDHCAQCGLWFEDDVGDRSAWAEHCVFHYNDQFSSFQERAEGDVDLQPRGVCIYDNVVVYDATEGLGGHHPELYGYIEQSVAVVPIYCPYCVFDETLTPPKRMHQFRDNGVFARHMFAQHLGNLDKTPTTMCPVPSCGTHPFTFFDLLYHLVAFHRLPIVGTSRPKVGTGGRKNCRLHLPVQKDDQLALKSMPTRSTDKAPIKEYYRCAGCLRNLVDINKHLTGAKLTSSCRQRGRYTPVLKDGTPLGEEISFDFSTVDASLAGSTSKRGRDHYCEKCGVQFVDIREHIPQECSSEFFRIKDQSHRHGRDGIRHRFVDWERKQRQTEALETVRASTCILGDMTAVLPQEIQDAMEMVLNDTLTITEKALGM